MNEISAPVSPGELIDKLTILQIKSRRISDAAKVANVRVELDVLTRCWQASVWAATDIRADQAALLAVNERLWDIEDRIRDKERAAIKKRLNVTLGSTIVEEKSYAAY